MSVSTRFAPPAPRRRRSLILVFVTGLLLTGWPLAAAAQAPTNTAPTATVRTATAQSAAGSTGVFAIDSDHHTVVFIPAKGGTPRPVTAGLTNPTSIVASRGGSVFIVDGTRLLKVTPRGGVLTIRTGMAPRADIAVDDNNYLFVQDGSTIVKYPPRDGSAAIPVGTGTSAGFMTVDALGNVSVTAPTPSDEAQTMITTFPVRGGKPTVRMLASDPPGSGTAIGGVGNVIEARDGTLYIELFELSGGSGASEMFRVAPGPAGPAPALRASPTFTEYVYNVDPHSNFYLLQNRFWCPAISRGDGCLDDYAVDFVQRYASSGSGPAKLAVTGVDLPVGGISVASSGAIYAAVLVSRSAVAENGTAVPQMLRIDPAGGSPVVLAKGHFSMPVAEDFLWFAH